MRQFLSAIAQSLGFVPRRKGKSVLVWGTSHGGFARARPILSELSKRNPRLNIYHLCPSPSLRSQLAAEGLESDVLATPARFGPWMQLSLLRSRAQLLIVVDEPDKEATQLIDRAAARDIPVVAGPLPGRPDGSTEPTQLGNWRSQVDLFIAFDEASAATLYRLGVEPEKVLRSGPPQDATAIAATAVTAVTAVVDALRPLIAVKRLPRGWGATGGRDRRGGLPSDPSSSLLSPIFRRKYRSISSLEELKAELGQPETIMCLGNGPSSEDPRLGDLHYDALFRVNHFWLPRGFLTEPQVVFTGVRAAIKAVANPVIFAFLNRDEEGKLMLKCLPLPRRIAFATAERLGVMDFGDFGVFTPTNGAVMLATAVALQPKRLIIAGMDLFQHPAGSYPGGSTTPNAYTVLHDRDTELHFILSSFDRFEGELIILSEVLDGHWRAHNKAGTEHTAKPGL